MKRVTGIGGLFFKCKDPQKIKDWYKKHLGFPVNEWGATFDCRDKQETDQVSYTVWSPFSADTEYFLPSSKEFMFNYRVENLVKLLEVLREEGVEVVGEIEEFDYGKFGWIMDPEGNKIELWEPVDDKLQ